MKGYQVNFGDICELIYGEGLPEIQRNNGPVPVYGSNGIVGWHDRAITKGPTIVIGRKGSIGEVKYSKTPCWPIDTTYYIDTTKKPCDFSWLYYMLLASNLTRLNKSAAIPGLDRNDVYAISVPFPPLPEQQRIAAILARADRLRRLRRYALELSDTYLQSVFVDMFGNPVTNPKGWDVHELGEHLTFITSGSRGWSKYIAPSGARFIQSFDVKMNHIADQDFTFVAPPINAEAKRTRVQPGDVLLTITGSRIGRVAPVPKHIGEAYISQHVALLRLSDTLRPDFVSMFLSHDLGGQRQIEQMQYGQTKPGLNFDQIRSFQVPCPPIAVQETFGQVLTTYERLRTQQREALRQAEHLFQTLLHRAFRGELTADDTATVDAELAGAAM